MALASKLFLTLCSFSLFAGLISCDLRSDTAKRGVEKYAATPRPPVSPLPIRNPVEPADIAEVDTSLEGDTIPITGPEQRKPCPVRSTIA